MTYIVTDIVKIIKLDPSLLLNISSYALYYFYIVICKLVHNIHTVYYFIYFATDVIVIIDMSL